MKPKTTDIHLQLNELNLLLVTVRENAKHSEIGCLTKRMLELVIF